jgi:hypothetical protein
VGRKLLSCSFAVVLIVFGAFAVDASAHHGGNGSFSCRASALRVFVQNPPLFSEPHVANAPDSPCTDDASSGPNAVVPGVASATLLDARTDADPGGIAGGRAEASVASAVLIAGGHTIKTGVLRSQASSSCGTETGKPVLKGSSSVELRIDGGLPLKVTAPLTIPLGPVTLRLNRKVVSGGVITQRAVEISVAAIGPLGPANVVLAEAVADVERCESVGRPPTAILEIKTPDNCGTRDDGAVACDGTLARTSWTHSTVPSLPFGIVTFFCDWPDDQSCVDHVMPCGQKDGYSLCQVTYRFRGTSSTDPDSDIVSWTLDFGDGTSVSGDWKTNPPTEVAHEYQIHHCPTCTREPATLTVTDATGQSDSDAQLASHEYPD